VVRSKLSQELAASTCVTWPSGGAGKQDHFPLWLALVILGGALATDAAATRASRLTVREALAYL